MATMSLSICLHAEGRHHSQLRLRRCTMKLHPIMLLPMDMQPGKIRGKKSIME